MTNIVNFRTRSYAKSRKRASGASALLASIARGLDEIRRTEFKSKEELQQALFFIELSTLHLRHFIGHVKNDESRARMLAQANRIEELAREAARKAAAL